MQWRRGVCGMIVAAGMWISAGGAAAEALADSKSAPLADQGLLPEDYWQQPVAKADRAIIASGHWTPLEIDLHPQSCGACHLSQFQAWRSSRHAHAYSAGLVGQFVDMGRDDVNACLSCHAPLAGEQLHTTAAVRASLQQTLRALQEPSPSQARVLPLRHSGVSCVVCHVRHGRRFGPPRRRLAGHSSSSQQLGWQDGAAHSGFVASRAFEQSQFCAACHQFPQSMAIHGKPLENTVAEWRQSRFAAQGVTCQQCHMPDRRHEFRGIHDPEMTRKGVRFALQQVARSARFTITSVWVGHAFPTYVTPEIVVRGEARDGDGKVLKRWQWRIGRAVRYRDGWQEVRDSRIMPGEVRAFVAAPLPAAARSYHLQVDVAPDHFYKGVYRDLLQAAGSPVAGQLIQHAAKVANSDDYRLYERTLTLH